MVLPVVTTPEEVAAISGGEGGRSGGLGDASSGAPRQEVIDGLCGMPKELSPLVALRRARQPALRRHHAPAGVFPPRVASGKSCWPTRDVARLSGATTLIELGSGTSENDPSVVGRDGGGGAAVALRAPLRRERGLPQPRGGVTLRPIPGHHRARGGGRLPEHHLGQLPRGGRRLVAFWAAPSATPPAERARASFVSCRRGCCPGRAAAGTDLIKDPAAVRGLQR